MKRASRQELFLLDSAPPPLIEHPWSMGHVSMDQIASTYTGINDLIICPSVGMEECGFSGDPEHNDDWAGVRSPWRDPCDGPNQGALRAALLPVR